MQTLSVYSEAGGVSKTTTAVSLATVAARELGKRVVLIDLDPRGAATKWLGLAPKGEGLHIGAILGNDDVSGWAEELAVPTNWHPELRFIPSDRSVSVREADRAEYAELRLRRSLEGVEADLIVIDCPNRQGGPLTLSALTASDTIIYAAAATADGIDGVEGARRSVQRFMDARRETGAPVNLQEAGIVVGDWESGSVQSRIAWHAVEELRETGMLLDPVVPRRAVVREVRLTHDFYGDFTKGLPVLEAYSALARKVIR